MRLTLKRTPCILLLFFLLLASGSNAEPAQDHPDVGSLEWVMKTGGALSRSEEVAFILNAVPGLISASAKNLFLETVPAVEGSLFTPPTSPIILEAIARLRATADPAFVNHSFRTAAWAIVVMKNTNPSLSPTEIEEAWLAGLLHDFGLAVPPPQGEFTLGGVQEVNRLASKYALSKESEYKISQAITLNPNSSIDLKKYGLLAWAMNVGGFGETFYGPYRRLMNAKNREELERLYPRINLKQRSSEIIDRELQRFPNQRFGLLRKIGFLKLTR